MPKRTINVYEVNVSFTVEKKLWKMEEDRCGKLTAEVIEDRIQQGIEVPIDGCKIKIVE